MKRICGFFSSCAHDSNSTSSLNYQVFWWSINNLNILGKFEGHDYKYIVSLLSDLEKHICIEVYLVGEIFEFLHDYYK